MSPHIHSVIVTTTTTATIYGPFSWTTRMSRYQKKHSPTHTYPDHQPSFISFLHLLRSIASSCSIYMLDSLFAQPLSMSSGLPLGLEPSISYSIHFFTQSLSSFRNTCPYHCSLFCCSTEIMSSIPSLFLSSSFGTHFPEHHTSIWPFASLPSEVPPRFLSLHITHTHLFTALWTLSGITQVSRYQNQSGFYWSKTKHSVFLQAGCHSCHPTNRVNALTHTHNRFTAHLEYVRVHPGEQVPER